MLEQAQRIRANAASRRYRRTEKGRQSEQRYRSGLAGRAAAARERVSDRYGQRMAEYTASGRKTQYGRTARAKIYAYIDQYLTANPCIDCGEKDIAVLEFDHVRGQKRYAVTSVKSMRGTIAEIDKCDVRCANCHRRATRARAVEGRGIGRVTWRTRS